MDNNYIYEDNSSVISRFLIWGFMSFRCALAHKLPVGCYRHWLVCLYICPMSLWELRFTYPWISVHSLYARIITSAKKSLPDKGNDRKGTKNIILDLLYTQRQEIGNSEFYFFLSLRVIYSCLTREADIVVSFFSLSRSFSFDKCSHYLLNSKSRLFLDLPLKCSEKEQHLCQRD